MTTYRGIVLAAIVALAPITASAGGLSPSLEESTPVVVVPQPAPKSSAQQLIVPAILIALIAVAVASNDDGGAKDIVTGGE